MPPVSISKSAQCPCGSGLKYIKCCGQYIKQGKSATTAEVLMRSRYSAYVLQNEEYLLNTWHHSTRPNELKLDSEPEHWMKLDIVRTAAGKVKDDSGQVEFTASFRINNERQRMHEVSNFVKEDGQWFYVDGEVD